MARHTHMFAALLSAAAALSGCQTVLIESHSDPSLGKPAVGRILVVASLPGEARRAAEEELVQRLAGHDATPSYRFLSPEESTRSSDIRRRAADEGFDSLIEMKSIGSSFRTRTGSGGYVETGFGFSGYVPGSLIEDIEFGVTFISLKDDRELFTCVVRRSDPWTLSATVQGVARRAVKRMKAEGLVD